MSQKMPLRGIAASSLLAKGDLSQICRRCATSIRLRARYASTATAAATIESAELLSAESAEPRSAYRICTGVILSRPPQITSDLHTFEKAFFLYQRRLNERLALPFTRYFYFSKGTPKFLDFQKKIKARKTAARDIGLYEAYGKHKWNDELISGAPESEPDNQLEALLKDERPFKDENEPAKTADEREEALYVRPSSRITDADKTGDQKSLNRLLQRTLYLMVQDKDGRWRFPTTDLKTKEHESLRSAAERALTQSGGANMNTWILGNHPVAHFEHTLPAEQRVTNERGDSQVGDLTFFMKGHIMAGQADIKDNSSGVQEFKWLAKEEIASLVGKEYWTCIANVLPER